MKFKCVYQGTLPSIRFATQGAVLPTPIVLTLFRMLLNSHHSAKTSRFQLFSIPNPLILGAI